jgi:hypothetical protein
MFLDAAAEANVFVIPVLWNGAVLTNRNTINLALDDDKLTSYIENALKVTSSEIICKHDVKERQMRDVFLVLYLYRYRSYKLK